MANKKDNTFNKLSSVHKTDINKRFFSGTFDQLFSSAEREKLNGFVGRKIGGCYDVNTDHYIDEPTKNRQSYQLEPTVISKDQELNIDHKVFYDDFINTLDFYGGNVNNHQRLFESTYHSWSPPIDVDKFINYSNYAWINNNEIPIVSLRDIDDDKIENQIIGNKSYTYLFSQLAFLSDGSTSINLTNRYYEKILFVKNTFNNKTLKEGVDYLIQDNKLSFLVEFSSNHQIEIRYEGFTITAGMVVDFPQSNTYDSTYFVEYNNGKIILLDNSESSRFQLLPDDITITDQDYLTIERFSCDNNAWSRTNQWVHLDAIRLSSKINGISVPENISVARRPIIEFTKNIQLYDYGSQFLSYVTYASEKLFSTVQGSSDSLVIDGQTLSDGDTLIFLNLSDVVFGQGWDTIEWDCGPWDKKTIFNDQWSLYVWKVNINNSKITLSLEHVTEDGDIVIVRNGNKYSGVTFYRNNNQWLRSSQEKTERNQHPLFVLYDCEGNRLDNNVKYPQSTFEGNKLFSYKENRFSTQVDEFIGIPLTYRTVNSVSDIVFDNNQEVDRYFYSTDDNTFNEIEGYYFYSQGISSDDNYKLRAIIEGNNESELFTNGIVVSNGGFVIASLDSDYKLTIFERNSSYQWSKIKSFDLESTYSYLAPPTEKKLLAVNNTGTSIAVASSFKVLLFEKMGLDWENVGEITSPNQTTEYNSYGKYLSFMRYNGEDLLVVSSSGTNPDNEKVLVYEKSCDGNNLWKIKHTITQAGSSNSYGDKVVYSETNKLLFVADEDNSNVYVYSYDGSSFTHEQTLSESGDFGTDIVLSDNEDEVFILEQLNNKIYRYDVATQSAVDVSLIHKTTITNVQNNITSIATVVSDFDVSTKSFVNRNEDILLVIAKDDVDNNTNGTGIVYVYSVGNDDVKYEFSISEQSENDYGFAKSVVNNDSTAFITSPLQPHDGKNTTGECNVFEFFSSNDGCNIEYEYFSSWKPATELEPQRVIDRFVITDVTKATYELSVLPLALKNNNGIVTSFNTIVTLNGKKLIEGTDYTIQNKHLTINIELSNNDIIEAFSHTEERATETFTLSHNGENEFLLSRSIYDTKSVNVSVNGFSIGSLFSVKGQRIIIDQGSVGLSKGFTVEVDYTSEENLPEDAHGYYEIPKSLEANPLYKDITTHSFSDFTEQFISIINNQSKQEESIELGTTNNYRDSKKDISLGTNILHHDSSVVKSMLLSDPKSNQNIIDSIRFSQREYVRYKNKLLQVVKAMIDNNEFDSFTAIDNKINSDVRFNEVIDRVTNILETNNTFNLSMMIGWGNVYDNDSFALSSLQNKDYITLKNFDITSPEIITYLTAVKNNNAQQESTMLIVDKDYEITQDKDTNRITITVSNELFSDLNNNVYDEIIIRYYQNIEPSHISATPSKMGLWPTYEPRIINDSTFSTPKTDEVTQFILGHDGSLTPVFDDGRDDLLLEFEKRIYNSIQSRFRNEVDFPLAIWDVKPGAYRNTNWTIDEYHDVVRKSFAIWANSKGINWRINEYYDDTDEWTYNYRGYGIFHDQMPGYWRGIFEYYYDTDRPHIEPWKLLGFEEQPSWWETEYGTDYSDANIKMWTDCQNGNIRQGSRKGIDLRFKRDNLLEILPVDSNGDIKSPIDIGLASMPLESDRNRDFQFGDGSPMEKLWKMNSDYCFHSMLTLFLMNPARFSELLWNTTDLIRAPVNKSLYIDKNICKRKPFENEVVHYESLNNGFHYKSGYNQWISDYMTFINSNVTNNLGNKIRTLDVNLGHKMAGYTNPQRINMYFLGTTFGSTSNSNLLPSENIHIGISTTPPIKDYRYSGVIIRKLSTGQFTVYGYDLLEPSFNYYKPSLSSKKIDLTIGGTSVNYTQFQIGQQYAAGRIVKYNNAYYSAKVSHLADKFDIDKWQFLSNKVPMKNAIEATYKPLVDKQETKIVNYGHVFDSVQDVVDFLIGYGAWLEDQGWVFDSYVSESNEIQNWLYSTKQFMTWVSQDWINDSIIQLSPLANKIKLDVDIGYPSNIEATYNGVYSLLDKNGYAINPGLTKVHREDSIIEVEPLRNDFGIYFAVAYSQQTEHSLVIDNTTSFNDIIYDPLLNSRQFRLTINGFRTKNWTGKYEAPGYIINSDQSLSPNIENSTESMRFYHDSEFTIDNVDIENAAQHFNGFEERKFLNNLGIVPETQYEFYKGMIREKGTEQSITKLLRSVFDGEDQSIKIFDEWALKVSDFGGICNNLHFDLKLTPTDFKVDPQILVFDSKQSSHKRISNIKILSAKETYFDVVPSVTITPNPQDNNINNIVDAEAEAIVGEDKKLKAIIVTKHGSGYTQEPIVSIGSATNGDIAMAVLGGEITEDDKNDDVINIDIDNDNRWIIKPRDCQKDDFFPRTKEQYFGIPTAGYVLESEIDFTAFNESQLIDVIQNNNINHKNTIWVAKNRFTTWSVYRITEIQDNITIDVDSTNNVFLTTTYKLPQFDLSENKTIQDIITISFDNFTSIEANKLTINVEEIGIEQGRYKYQLTPLSNDEEFLLEDIDDTEQETQIAASLWFAIDSRFMDDSELSSVETTINSSNYSISYEANEKTWIDNNALSLWSVQEYDGSTWEEIRSANPYGLIDTRRFISAYIYDYDNQQSLARLPVYDPFKGIFPGPADQNIDFKTEVDPTTYTNSNDSLNINENKAFSDDEVGCVWWDLSTMRVLNYEQSDNYYRRNKWGSYFEGSSFDVYEWVRSLKKPSEYTGEGIPKNETDYVKKIEYDVHKEREITVYYFWVKDKTTNDSKRSNRTLSVSSVASLLRNPKTSRYRWFSPINTVTSNAIILSNITDITSSRTTGIQFNYTFLEKNTENHSEWNLIRNNDERNSILNRHWDKLVDSIVGFTRPIVINDDVSGKIKAEKDGQYYLIVPDPSLSDDQKYGNAIRPRQSWFRNIHEARETFVQKFNDVMSDICIRSNYPDWNKDIDSHEFWSYEDWYKNGFNANNATPSRQVFFTQQLANLDSKVDGEIVKVVNADTLEDENGIKTTIHGLYQYDSASDTFENIMKEKCMLVLSDRIWKTRDHIALRDEFRSVIEAVFNHILIGDMSVKKDNVFFAMLHYVYKEQNNVDWAFKTSYILVNQLNVPMEKNKFLQNDKFTSVIDYINAVKPYQTKIRDFNSVHNVGVENIEGTIIPEITNTISMKIANVSCGGWDSTPWDSVNWDAESVDCVFDIFNYFGGSYETLIDEGWDIKPWDSTSWDASIVDDSEEEIMQGFNSANTNLYKEVEPDHTFTYVDGIANYLLSDPIDNELGPSIYIVDKVTGKSNETLNFTYNTVSNSFSGSGDNSYIIGLKNFVGIIDVLVNGTEKSEGIDYTISIINNNVTVNFVNAPTLSDTITVKYNHVRLYEPSITDGDIIDIYVNPPVVGHWSYSMPTNRNGKEQAVPYKMFEQAMVHVDEKLSNGNQYSFTIYHDIYGIQHAYRNVDSFGAELDGALSADAKFLNFKNEGIESKLNPTPYEPIIIRINRELIKVYGKSNNQLTNLIRGWDGTPIIDHDDGEPIWFHAPEEIVINEQVADWLDGTSGNLEDSTTQQATFITQTTTSSTIR